MTAEASDVATSADIMDYSAKEFNKEEDYDSDEV